MLTRYKDWAPTTFDTRGLTGEEHSISEWYVAPVLRHRDSGPLDQSNFKYVLDHMEALPVWERENITDEDEEPGAHQVHRFGHWAHGWYEVILCNPDYPGVEEFLTRTTERLEDYPILDESDFCDREYKAAMECWDDYGYRDLARDLKRTFGLSDNAEDVLLDCNDELYQLYRKTETDWTVGQDGSTSFDFDSAIERITREDVARVIKAGRKARAAA